MNVVEVPLSKIPEMIRANEFNHALMLASLLFLSLDSQQGAHVIKDALKNFQGS